MPIIFDINNGVGLIKINRPEVLNALNSEHLKQLKEILKNCREARVIILTGEGTSFIAGADVKEMASFNAKEIREFLNLGNEVANLLEQGPYITIAAVNGYAFGGGLEMALACDFIYASTNALFGLPEVKLGLIPGFGGTQRFRQAIGIRKAKELICTGKTINAEEALNYNLINKAFPPHILLSESMATASTIINNSSEAVLNAKKAINAGEKFFGFEEEQNLFQSCFEREERKLAMNKFLEKKHAKAT